VGGRCGSGRAVDCATGGKIVSVSILRTVYSIRMSTDALPASARQVLACLAFHCNHKRGDRIAEVSIRTLAAETGLAHTTVIRDVDILIRQKMVVADRRRNVVTRYWITDPKGWPRDTQTGSATLSPNGSATLSPHGPEVVHQDQEVVAPRYRGGSATLLEQGLQGIRTRTPPTSPQDESSPSNNAPANVNGRGVFRKQGRQKPSDPWPRLIPRTDNQQELEACAKAYGLNPLRFESYELMQNACFNARRKLKATHDA
jgi:hypothetical protein